MNNFELLTMIKKFPIGGQPKDKNELLSKVEIISFLARFQEQFSSIKDINEREFMVKKFFEEALALKEDEIPALHQAERILKLSPGFIQDYGKVQYIKENNQEFAKIYDLIANSLDLNATRKVR